MKFVTSWGGLVDYSFVRIRTADGSWDQLKAEWSAQCDALEEDFDSYAGTTFEVLRELVDGDQTKAGVFSLKEGGSHVAICQVNCASIPKYVGPVLRTRFITFSPECDLTDKRLSQYSRDLIELLFGVIELGFGGDFASRHVKLHLRSPEDAKFFSAIGRGLSEHENFESVETRGQWLYLSRK